MADLSATVAKHARKLGSQLKIGFPPKPNTENIVSLEALRISGISTTQRDGKWPTTHDATLFLIQSDSRLSHQLVLSTMAHFHLEHWKALWTRDTTHFFERCQRLKDFQTSITGVKHVGLYKRYRQCVSVASSRSISKSGVGKWWYFRLGCWHRSGVLQSVSQEYFTANLFRNGIFQDYVSYSFGRNNVRNVQSKH